MFWTGFSHIPGTLKSADIQRLPHTRAFYPTVPRPWVVDFWNLPVKWVFVAMPVGFLTMLLFYFDHVGQSTNIREVRHALRLYLEH